MTLPEHIPGSTISSILRHDRKVASYKIALVRSINDVVLAFPDVPSAERPIAIPLRMLAAHWVGYYWPLADPAAPIRQGARFLRKAGLTQDISFRLTLEVLRRAWETAISATARPADGYFLVSELRTPHRAQTYPLALHKAYRAAVRAIMDAMLQPIQYAGPGGQEWSIFPQPAYYRDVQTTTTAVPGTLPGDRCLIVSAELWRSFSELSLWVEALCVHEWCLFTDQVAQDPGQGVDRGNVYRLLTERPENRRPLTWERNAVEIILMEGGAFICPWTKREIVKGTAYDLDHIVPIAAVPMNELWNLVPADPKFNQHEKRDRLPSMVRLAQAEPAFAQTYTHYHASKLLTRVLRDDVALRFQGLTSTDQAFPVELAQRVTRLVDHIGVYRNLARF